MKVESEPYQSIRRRFDHCVIRAYPEIRKNHLSPVGEQGLFTPLTKAL